MRTSLHTNRELKAEIIRAIADIQPDDYEKVIGNFVEHVYTCRRSGKGRILFFIVKLQMLPNVNK